MYLLDTNVLSELRKRRSGKINPAVEAWASSVDQADMYLSVITIMEVELGIALLERRDSRQAGVLRLWLHEKVRGPVYLAFPFLRGTAVYRRSILPRHLGDGLRWMLDRVRLAPRFA